MIHTHTHTSITFANPYLICSTCRGWVTGWHNPEECACDGQAYNLPCSHAAGVQSVCPSWSPVDGCRCIAHLGSKDHPEPPR